MKSPFYLIVLTMLLVTLTGCGESEPQETVSVNDADLIETPVFEESADLKKINGKIFFL